MTSTPPTSGTYTVSGHQAVLSAGIAVEDMDYLVKVAQDENVPRAKLVKRIIREWREQHEAQSATTETLTVVTAEFYDTLVGDDSPGQVVPKLVELFERSHTPVCGCDTPPSVDDDDALTAQVVAAQAIETFYGGRPAPVPDGVAMLSDAELAELDSGGN